MPHPGFAPTPAGGWLVPAPAGVVSRMWRPDRYAEVIPVVRLTRMHGCPVISARTGDRLGRVGEVIVHLGERRITGFRLRRGGLLDRRWRMAAMQDVTAASEAAVVLPDDVALREDERSRDAVGLGRSVTRVIGSDGRVIGRLTDVVADLQTGYLDSLLITPADRRSNRSRGLLRVPIAAVSGRGDATVMVTAETMPLPCEAAV